MTADGSPPDAGDDTDGIADCAGDGAGSEADEGDPFEDLAAGIEDEAGNEPPEASDADGRPGTDARGPDDSSGARGASVSGDGPDDAAPLDDLADRIDGTGPTDAVDATDESGASGSGGVDRSGDREGPLSDLAASVDERRDGEPPGDDLFTEEDVPGVDPDVVWEQLEAEDPVEEEPTPPGRRVERVVDTGQYCEGCEHFSPPPEVHCAHEGTEIVEMVDVDRFRVLDCPKVREDERLERL